MNNSTISDNISKRLLRTLVATAALLFSLYCFILAPLYTYMSADVLFSVTVIPEIIKIIMDIIDVLSYSLCFSTIIYSIYKFSLSGSVRLMIVYCAAVLLKYAANVGATFIFDGKVSLETASYVVVYFTLDAAILLTVALIAAGIFKKYKENRAYLKKANNALGKATPSVEDELFGGSKLFVRSNPLHRSALWTGIILSLIKILSRLLFDIAYGAPSSAADALWMITYYISDILITVIVYAISLYLFTHFHSKEQSEKNSN